MFNPPRMMNVPQQPLPQTVQATLEHSGIPYSDNEMITDIPPSFDWMPLVQVYSHTFEYSTKDLPQKELAVFTVHNWISQPSGNPEYLKILPWTLVPFFCSKWWTGQVSFKFIAIKPPRVTGKILIRYSFDPFEDFEKDTRRRSIAKEWDLGQSSECEFDITGINTIKARPTWLPRVTRKMIGGEHGVFAAQGTPMTTWHMGTIRVEAGQLLQPGSIFPDSIRILVFKVYKNTQFYVPTDIRGSSPHTMCLGFEDLKTVQT